MRSLLIALPLLIAPAPALAAPKDASPLPAELSDPAMAERLGKMMGALTRALMDLPVGEIEAAAEGRDPTPADRSRRIRDQIGGADAERTVEAQAAASGRAMQAAGQALAASLPAIHEALRRLESDMERATANLPDPAYPKR